MTPKATAARPDQDRNVGASARCAGCADRRTILKVGLTGAALAAFPFACLEPPIAAGSTDAGSNDTPSALDAAADDIPPPPPKPTCTTLADKTAADVPLGTLLAIGTDVGRLILGRDEGGLYVMSGNCTHQGYGLDVVSPASLPLGAVIACAFHGARFDGNGGVVQGPAAVGLRHYPLEITADGAIKICIDATVPPETRTT